MFEKEVYKRIGSTTNKRKIFKIGENVVVSHGGFISAKIIDIIEDGFYKVEISYAKHVPYSNNRYTPTIEEREYVWCDIFKTSKKEPSELSIKEEMRISYFNSTIESLISRFFCQYGLNLNPPYQREIVWKNKQKEMLLDSIFSKLDIGKFVFIKNRFSEEENWFGSEVLDGKQRLTTLVEYFTDSFKYKGFYYSELSFEDKYTFKNTQVSIGEVDEEYATEKNILNYFIKLNTTGIPMDKKHIEKIKEMCNEN